MKQQSSYLSLWMENLQVVNMSRHTHTHLNHSAQLTLPLAGILPRPKPSAANAPPRKYVAHTPAWASNSTRLPHTTQIYKKHVLYVRTERSVADVESVVLSLFCEFWLQLAGGEARCVSIQLSR